MTEEELKQKLDIASDAYHKRLMSAPPGLDSGGLEDYMRVIQNVVDNLSQQYRLIQTPEMRDISKYGDIFTLEEFVEAVKEGWFIDYDGSGNYATDKQESNISIYPSDITSGRGIRKDFTHVVWYNK